VTSSRELSVFNYFVVVPTAETPVVKGMGIIFVINYLKCLKLCCNYISQGIILASF
jgi:hypothetical protein